MTTKEMMTPATTTRRRFLGRLVWFVTALTMLPILRRFGLHPVTQRELPLSEADLFGPHDLAG